MTIQATPRAGRWLKSDPDCRGDRHAPQHDSYIHGCRCPETIAAEALYREVKPPPPPQGTRGALPAVHDNPRCRAESHRPTQAGWNNGCRCSGAMAAHERWLELRRIRRAAARARAALRTGDCTADKHDSVDAYSWGCRCPGTMERYQIALQRRAKVDRDPRSHWRRGNRAVDRNNLWMLLHGIVDAPTSGELLAAFIALEGTLVAASPWTSRPINDAEIAARIGVVGATIERLRRKRVELRESRTERRLADVYGKARDVRRAAGRKERVAGEHAAALERKAAWKQHCRTLRRLRESRERAERIERRNQATGTISGGARRA